MDVVSVTQLNTYIKACFDENQLLKSLYVNGEISNFKHAYSGHFYFTLKDDTSQLKCVMFSSSSSHIRFEPKDGMRIVCRGRVSSYERDGVYQLYVEDMQPDGLGALNLAYEQLKAKLREQGLFDEKIKKAIPVYPTAIGVITSPTGAVIEDIKKVLARRYPIATIVLLPIAVQGTTAPDEIARGIRCLNARGDIDTIILARGGGSIEDLWSFNTELVARAVAASEVPIISAVGHETDYTICDFVADLRAPTPSVAAELAVPDRYGQMIIVSHYMNQLEVALQNKLDYERQHLDHIMNMPVFTNKAILLGNQRAYIADMQCKLTKYCLQAMHHKKMMLGSVIHTINALNPLSVLGRGYAVVYRGQKLIKSVTEIEPAETITVKLQDGTICCSVIKHSEVPYE